MAAVMDTALGGKMYDLFYDHIDFGGETPSTESGADPTPEELEAFWAWVATLNPDPEIPF